MSKDVAPALGAVPLTSHLLQSPQNATPAPVLSRLDLLPFDLMPWEAFEAIQWRMLRDVEGLREAQLYGERGQSQYGLDVVALAPDHTGVALQSKRYQKRFGPAELGAAVAKFQSTQRPFAVSRLIIGVSREVKTTKSIEELAKRRKAVAPLQLDLWDKRALSTMLRDRPQIVIEYFGMETAKAFCLPFELTPIPVPSAEAVAVREALARTPEVATGAAAMLERADRIEADEPAGALELVGQAQSALGKAGFGPHARQLEPRRTRLLAVLDRAPEAARRILEEVWEALDQGQTTTAQSAQLRLEKLALDNSSSDHAAQYLRVAQCALKLHMNPLGLPPSVASLPAADGIDRLRLAVIAGETALAVDDHAWLEEAHDFLGEVLQNTIGEDAGWRTRLRLLVAEASHDWSTILTDARRVRLGHELGALVAARYARRQGLRELFREADALWEEATGDASLAGRWSDATAWVFSRRVFMTRWKLFASDELLPLQAALREQGPAPRIVPAPRNAHENALDSLRRGRLRAAAISAQRALRDAIATGDWAAETTTRDSLGAILSESDEPALAAHHYARAGAVKALVALADANPDTFVDNTADLDAPNYWTVGAAY